jgi:serine/threonine protein kinase
MANADRKTDAHPETLGRYRLRGVLGQGGMGRLYVAEQNGIAGFTKIVALKQILPHLADSPEFRKMFLTEARIAARLEHPNIVVTYELGEVDGVYFMAMEYLPGEDLGAVISRCRSGNPVPIEIAMGFAHQALSGLQYAHDLRDSSGRQAGLVHRDVNPSNLFVTYHGMVKLLDFGVVKGGSTTGTTPGVFKGKHGHCAPEQLEGNLIDRRTDLFCVGIVLWELLTGQRLFKGATDVAVIDAVRAQPIVPPSALRAGVPAGLNELVMKALSRDPARRFQSANEMSEALDRLLSQGPDRPTAKTIGQWLETLFGPTRAGLKKAIAQGNEIESAITQLAAMNQAAAASAGNAAAHGGGSVAGRSRPSMQPRSLWSNSSSVRKIEGSGGAAPAPGSAAFVPFGGEPENEGQADQATSRFVIPHALAEAAGLTSSSVEPLPPPASSPPPPVYQVQEVAVVPPTMAPVSESTSKAGGRMLAGIAGVAALAAAVVVVVTLRGGRESVPPSPVAAQGAVEVEIRSEPPGAQVLIDGAPTGLSTPAVLRNLRPGGVFEVRLDRPGYQTAVRKVTLSNESAQIQTLKLVAASATIRLEGLPRDGQVYVDDMLAQVSGGAITVPLGTRKLRVESGGEVVFDKVITAEAAEQSVKIRPAARSE